MTIERVERTGAGDDEEYEVTETASVAVWDAGTSFSVVGRRFPRLEGVAKVTGQARYSYDVRLPGQLYAAVLRSPLPHATIRTIDTSRAEALPGVHAVLSFANAPEIEWYEDGKLFDRTVRFVGDEVAAVAADSLDIAVDALGLITVEYQALPFAVDLEAALAPGAPRLRKDGNISGEPQEYERGDVAAGFGQADVVVERTYTTQTALHNCLEPHGCTAVWEGEQLTLWSSTQSIWTVREEVAEKLHLPEHRVRVIKQFMGGGFGSKQVSWKHDVIAALLARQSGRPVQLMLDRGSENVAAGNRNATRQRVRIGARRDGTLTAIEARLDLETGAYQVGGEASDVAGTYQTLYACPNVRTYQQGVYTNMGPAVAFRAPGHVEATWALEQAIDELARSLGLDPLELRLRNYTERDQSEDKPDSSPQALRRCYERASEEFGWGEQRDTQPAERRVRRGVGIAAHDWPGGNGQPPGYATLKLNADGTAEVQTGTQDIGTGTRTSLAQIAAEELGLPMEHVALHLGDTASGLYSPASAGSTTQATIGPAVREAAAEVRRQLLQAAAPMLEEPPQRLMVRDGTVVVVDDPHRSIPVAEVCGRIAPHMIAGRGVCGPTPEDVAVRTFGVQCAEVEVDLDSGEVTVLRIVAAHDCGRIINPATVDSQIIGGVMQGLGYALTEERVVDARSGIVLNANLEEYKVPTMADLPAITHAQVDLPDPQANVLGAKGIGEPPIIPTAPAIANAIFDATGIRIVDAPVSRQRLVAALARREAQTGAQQA